MMKERLSLAFLAFNVFILVIANPENNQDHIAFKKEPNDSKPMEEPVHYGILHEEDPDQPMFYDTFFPILFEIEMPVWNSTDLRLVLPPEYSNVSKSCNETNTTTTTTEPDLWSATVCPMLNKLNELLDDFAYELKMIESFNATTKRGNQHYSSCHAIKPHFSHHVIDDGAMELYLLKALLDCPMQDIVHQRFVLTHVNQTRYKDLLRDFFDTYVNPRYRMGGYVKYAASSNILLSLHSTQLFEHLMYATEWSSSMAVCNSQRIPSLLVSPDSLQSALLIVKEKSERRGLELTIPLTDLSSYYKLALTDCAMTTSNTYMVRVLVPLTKVLANYKKVTFRPVPYLNKEVEDSGIKEICYHKTPFRSIVIQGNTRLPVAVAKCDESQLLCQVPPEGDRDLFGQCLLDTLYNRSHGVILHCHKVCVDYDESMLPYIKRIKSDQFVIVGKSSAEIAIMSTDVQAKPLKIIEVPDHVGSLIATIPCGSYISHRAEKYYVDGDCSFDINIVPVKAVTFEDVEEEVQKNMDFIKQKLKKVNVSIPQPEKVNQMFEAWADAAASKAIGHYVWPMYLAATFSIIGILSLVVSLVVWRNVYIRVGKLELSIARNDCPITQFTNMTFNVRDAATDSVY